MNMTYDVLSSRFQQLHEEQIFLTPSGKKNFKIQQITTQKIIIQTQGGTLIGINRAAFLRGLSYLTDHSHTVDNKIRISSNKSYTGAGPLCRAIRDANGGGRMVSTYVLPILAELGFVGIDGSHPNKTWLI